VLYLALDHLKLKNHGVYSVVPPKISALSEVITDTIVDAKLAIDITVVV